MLKSILVIYSLQLILYDKHVGLLPGEDLEMEYCCSQSKDIQIVMGDKTHKSSLQIF